MNASPGPENGLTVFGVPLVDLVLSFRGDPNTAKAILAAERYLLGIEQLKTDPGESAEDLAAVTEGIAALAAGPREQPGQGTRGETGG